MTGKTSSHMIVPIKGVSVIGLSMRKFFLTSRAAVTRLRQIWQRLQDAIALQTSKFASPAAAFVSQPEPRSYGLATRGLQMMSGNFRIAGEVVQAEDQSIWDLPQDDQEFAEELNGFAWLDDLAACDDLVAHKQAQDWLMEWIPRTRWNGGTAWRADITGRRVVRWINHAILLLHHLPTAQSKAYFNSLGHQAHFLSKRWRSMRPGLPRFEALTGLVYCGLALEGKRSLLAPAIRALGAECRREIGADGGIDSRNPEELMEIFTLMAWVAHAATAARVDVEPELLRALERMAPTLRALRLGDGGLVRFHGGGAGQSERLDQALADAGIRLSAHPMGAMGYTRLACGATQLVMDTQRLPSMDASAQAHAGTLSFEMSSGRLPVLVNMGRSYGFSDAIRDACRATPAHNTLCLENASSARFAAQGFAGRTFGRRLVDAPRLVTVLTDENQNGKAVRSSHDGYVRAFGLTHFRQISVVNQGGKIVGEDAVKAETALDRARFIKAAKGRKRQFVRFSVHFHLHPDVAPILDMKGKAVSLTLLNGEVWVFRAGGRKMELRRSAYMERGRLKPRATKQIVVTSRAVNYEGLVNWTLTRSA
ncbi:MAG: heparinase [Rhodobacteraceae bacterium]|nr:heparinase [Paracoccaceae bacterium]